MGESLHRIVEDAYGSAVDLVVSVADPDPPAGGVEIDEFRSGTSDSGTPFVGEEVEHTLYVEEQVE